MSKMPSGSRSVIAGAVASLLCLWSAGCAGLAGGRSAEPPILRLTGFLIDHSLRGDASQDFGSVKVRIVVRRYSTAEELQQIRRLAEAGDEPGFHKAFGRLEVGAVEYPTTGTMRERCYAAIRQPSPRGTRIILFSFGIMDRVMKMWHSKVTELDLDPNNEGGGQTYRSRIVLTEDGEIVFERIAPGPGTPGQITDLRPIK